DSAKYIRAVPVGTLAVYAMEFQRDNQWIYALWTPRGEREITVQWEGNAKSTFTDLYGRETLANGIQQKLTISTAVSYLTSPVRVAQITAGKSAFPDVVIPPSPFVVNPLEKMADCTLQETGNYSDWPLAQGQNGNFELRQVEDPLM